MKSNFFSTIVKWSAGIALIAGTNLFAVPGNVNIGNLPAGKSVRVTYVLGISSTLPNGVASITNQAAVAGSNFSSSVTDDPTTVALNDPTITIVSVPPVLGASTNSVAEDATLSFTVASFTSVYSDANADGMTNVQITLLPTIGTLKLSGTDVTLNQNIPSASLANLTFLGTTNLNGNATFAWKATDSAGLQSDSAATSTITIVPGNDAPTATNDILSSVAEDSGVRTIAFAALATNDSTGPANESTQLLTITSVTNAVGGTVSIVGTNVIFTTATNFNGASSFTYVVQDNGTTAGTNDFKTSTASVSFITTEVNDQPVAVNDSLSSTNEDFAPRTISFAILLANDSAGPTNESSQTMTIVSVSNPVGGTASISGTNVIFTATANFNGTASFNYVVQDNGTTAGANDFKSATGSASFTVTEVADYDYGDAPATYSTLSTNSGPRHFVAFGGPALFLGTVPGDIEADAFASSDASGDNNNNLNDEDGVILPAAFVIGNSSNITVIASASGMLNAWVDFNRNGNFLDAGEQIFTNRNLSAGSNSLSVAVVTVTGGGSFARFRFSNQSNLTPIGVASDGEVEDYAVTLVANVAPSVANDTLITRQNTSVGTNTSFLLANDQDADGDPLTVVQVSATSTNGGSVTLVGQTVTYTPVNGFFGIDRFSYTVSDGRGATSIGTVVVRVISANAPAQNKISITKTASGWMVRFLGEPGQSYIAQWAQALNNSWTPLSGPLVADPTGLVEFEDRTFPPPSIRFYQMATAP